MRLSSLSEAIAGDHVKSVVCVVLDTSKGAVLMGKAAKNDYDDRDGKWCFPGGGIKNKELTVEQAAERECEEEAGIRCQADGIIQYGTPDGKVPDKVAFVRCIAQPGHAIKFNHEFSEMRWMSPQEALSQPDLFEPNKDLVASIARQLEDVEA